MKNIIKLLLVICFTVSCFGSYTMFAENTEDKFFAEAYGLLSELGAVSDGENLNKNNKITRGEIAEAVSAAMGLNTISTVTRGNDMYLGYTNEDTFEQQWQWIADAPAEEDGVNTMKNATPFYDVTTLHENWEAINKVAIFGIMNGSGDGYFRPDDYAEVNEVVAVCVKLLGAEIYTDKNYPVGYNRVAGSEGLTDNIEEKNYSNLISLRDFYVMLYNTITSKYYKVYEYGETYKMTKTDTMYVSDTHDIYKIQGIVTANEKTHLDNNEKLAKKRIVIDNQTFICNKYDTDELLGTNITAYYKMTNDMDIAEIVFIVDTKSAILEIAAEDIISYNNYTYTYRYSEDKKKTENISADVDVIFNGKALTDYKPSDLKPKNGKITLIDSDNDDTWDILKIESIKIMFVEGADAHKEVIYGQNTDFAVLNLKDIDYDVYDKDGNENLISNIRKNDIIAVKENTSLQGERYYHIQVVTGIIHGEVEKVSDEFYTISGVEYEISPDCMTQINFGDYGDFYLDNNDHIYNFIKQMPSTLTYGYVVKAAPTDDLDTNYEVRLFLTDGTFANYTLNKKVKLNRKSVSNTKAFEVFVDEYETIKNQLILFSADENLVINEIQTSDVFEDGLQKNKTWAGVNLVKRNTRALVNNTANSGGIALWTDAQSSIMLIPKDASDEENYAIKAWVASDTPEAYDEIYVTNKDAAVANVLIQFVEQADGNVLAESSNQYMVTDVKMILGPDEEPCYSVGIMNFTSEQTVYTRNDKLDKYIADIERGDIVRLTLDGLYITAIRKLYDVGTHTMLSYQDTDLDDGEDVNGPRAIHQNFYHHQCITHGFAGQMKAEDGYFSMNVAEYENNALVGPSTTEFLMKNTELVYIVYDSEKKTKPYLGSIDDIVFTSDNATGSELIAHHQWSTGKTLYIIK